MTPYPILAAMLRLPAYSGDQFQTGEREALYLPIASAIALTAKTKEEAAALVANGYHESGFAKAVLAGECHRMPEGARCDRGKARGAWQVWPWCKATTPAGEAQCVLSQLRLGLQRCSSWDGAFGALTGAWLCTSAPAKTQTMRRILSWWR